MCLFRSSQFTSDMQEMSVEDNDDDLHTDPLRPGKLKNTSGPFRCGI